MYYCHLCATSIIYYYLTAIFHNYYCFLPLLLSYIITDIMYYCSLYATSIIHDYYLYTTTIVCTTIILYATTVIYSIIYCI